MPKKTHLFFLRLVLVLAAGCSNSTDTGSGGANDEVVADLRAYETENFEIAKEACGYTGTHAEYEQLEEASSDADSCMFELSVVFSDCAVQVLGTHETDARAYLTCAERDRTAMLECCRGSDGLCTYDAIDACYATLWDGDSHGACSYDAATIRTAIDKCEAESATAEGNSSSSVGGASPE